MTTDEPSDYVVTAETVFDRETETVGFYLDGSLYGLVGLVGATDEDEQ